MEKISLFKRDDGSFSYKTSGNSLARIYGTPISHGAIEGDMNAVALADSSRFRCLSILGIDAGGICTEEARREFFRIINEKLAE